MGFRFRRSVRLFPGFSLNFSKSGVSASMGPRGLRYTIGPKGTRLTAGIPGTGLSWTEYQAHVAPASPVAPSFPLSANNAALIPIENADADQINGMSTSELAAVLNSAHRRMQLSPSLALISASVFGVCIYSQQILVAQAAAIAGVVFLLFSCFVDRYRRSLAIAYKPDGAAAKISDALAQCFADLQQSSHIWNVTAGGATSDWKRNAGANHLIKRERTYAVFTRPSCIRGDLSFPSIRLGKDDLFFLPDAMLLIGRKSVAALQYRDFLVTSNTTRFIEEEGLPSDATVVGRTWRFVNKSGGPDRRFNNNGELPVCLYGTLALTSAGGLNCLLHLSNPAVSDRFVQVEQVLSSYDASQLYSKSFSSLRLPQRWPAAVLLFSFFIVQGLLLLITFWPAMSAASDARPQPSSVVQSAPAVSPQPIATPALLGPLPLPRQRPSRH